jgi:hypothetical protein
MVRWVRLSGNHELAVSVFGALYLHGWAWEKSFVF